MALGDMFLRIEGAGRGAILGEARDAAHKDEIDVLGWSWGMEGNLVHGAASPKTTVRELKVQKRVDRASTGLMAALRNNEVIRKATLTVRKAGGAAPLEYYTLAMEKVRVTALVQHAGAPADPAELVEELSLAFSKFAVEYKPQGEDGLARGAGTFEMDIFQAT